MNKNANYDKTDDDIMSKLKIMKTIPMMHRSRSFVDKLPPWRPEEECGLNI